MAAKRVNDPIEPMTLGNMRANGVRSLDVCCWACHHRAIMSADPWPDGVPVPTFGPRMVCTRCGIIGADARPHWQEQPQRESLTGVRRFGYREPWMPKLGADTPRHNAPARICRIYLP
jgi:hypothetical protein